MNDFAQPKLVTDGEIKRGDAARRLLPKPSEIPKEFLAGRTSWNLVAATWFMRGMKGARFKPHEGVEKGWRCATFAGIFTCYQVAHRYREAAAAYLMSLWFDEVKIVRAPEVWR